MSDDVAEQILDEVLAQGYGIAVRPEREYDANARGLVATGRDHWHVRMPHQCEQWDIAGDYGEGVPHADAVAALEAFIEEARQALEALMQRHEFGRDDS